MGDTDSLYFDLSNFRLPQTGKSESLLFGMKRSLLMLNGVLIMSFNFDA